MDGGSGGWILDGWRIDSKWMMGGWIWDGYRMDSGWIVDGYWMVNSAEKNIFRLRESV